jgi:hypothetical protein
MAKKDIPSHLKRRIIFSYSTRHLAQKDKVRFFYALKGRNGKEGIIGRIKVEQLGKTVLLIDAAKAAELREFLAYWKCAVREKEVWTLG